MFSRGSDMVSVGRAAMENPGIIEHLVDSVTQFQVQTGWYNSPKHVCSGKGDLRGLSFCCLPVKPCAVHHKVNDLGLSAQEFADLKVEFAKGTMLEYGDSTCFGSLVWCCKLSKPCYIRNGVMDVLGLSGAEYMRLKKDLADYILDKAKKPVNES
jgi:putative methanogenesis marker domain 9